MSEHDDLQLARTERERQNLALVLVRDGQVLATGARGGVADLLEILRRPELDLAGASLSDRVVGRAAAMLVRCAGIARVHAGILSEPAAGALEEAGIAFAADRCVPHILNRAGSDFCPLERLSLAHTDPEACRRAIEEFVGLSAKQVSSEQ